METDLLSRRLRQAAPQPKGQRIAVTPDDLALFSAINRHGPLPTTYLHAFVKSKNFNAFQYRLTKLYNGSERTPPLLSRPPQQFQSFNARYQPLVYDLTKLSQSILAESGTSITSRTDGFLHRLMGACVGASIELACREARICYIPRAEILAKRSSSLAIQVNGKDHIPDDLFGLQYSDKSYRFFAVEIDRQTESIERSNLMSTAFDRKLRRYLDVMHGRLHETHWGVPNHLVLTVTTNATHMSNIIHHLDRMTATAFKKRFLFKTQPEIGINWKIPSILPGLLHDLWARTGTPFCISGP